MAESELQGTDIIYETVNISPNPAHEIATISVSGGKTFDLSIMNTTGRTVYSLKDQKASARIDCTDLLPGIYVIKIITSTGFGTRTLIVE